MDQPIRSEPGLGESGREQIGAGEAPQHRPRDSCHDPGGEQRRRGGVGKIRPASDHLVQRAQGQAAARQAIIKRRDPERQ